MTQTQAQAQDLHPYHDCLTGLVNQIVAPHAPTELLWSECKLYAFKNPKDLVFYQPKILSMSDEISRFSGIKASHSEFSTEPELKAYLHAHLEAGRSIICLVDTFNLPFCRTYQTQHAAHWLSVTGYREGHYQLFDHYYQFQGEMEEGQFHECMLVVTTNMEFEKAHCYTIDAQGFTRPSVDQYKQAIADNLTALTDDSAVGQPIDDPIITEELIIVAQGLSVFDVALEKLAAVEESAEHQVILNIMSNNFKGMASSRFLFSEFLEAVDAGALEQRTELSAHLKQLAQDYLIYSNLCLKAMFDRVKSLKSLRPRLERLKEQEVTLIRLLDEYHRAITA